MIDKEKFLDYNFVVSESIEQVALSILEYQYDINTNILPIIFTPNVDYIVKLNNSKFHEIRERLKKSAFILPDGQPIIWASKFYKGRIITRLAGSDLFSHLYRLIKKRQTASLFLTSGQSVSNFYQQDFPTGHILTLPYIDPEKNIEFEKIIDESVNLINNNNIKYVFIGVSFPKQDKIALGIFDKLKTNGYKNIPVLALIGASLEFEAGIKKRAPVIFQKIGLEWFFRFLLEPKRLFKRYFIDSFQFIKIVRMNKNV
ncbi:WecB/TagA/CpsF family glycosyltransferase [Pedobacter sp. PF22-3]|uniref:WecB/TagA/CpsF family glycosyltransferase n=1 Tax=Pedobacter sp. PF22-3 TaxID=2994467 RepID=UPI002247C11F|nr:WecB/TagA/CpsF family glycosyltransferase [Pedobacter sp. PF22-3]MCX2494145.1 WecB/TagA/CpsF family glycosyltransferase [Pedobacter sp. PF22-3]